MNHKPENEEVNVIYSNFHFKTNRLNKLRFSISCDWPRINQWSERENNVEVGYLNRNCYHLSKKRTHFPVSSTCLINFTNPFISCLYYFPLWSKYVSQVNWRRWMEGTLVNGCAVYLLPWWTRNLFLSKYKDAKAKSKMCLFYFIAKYFLWIHDFRWLTTKKKSKEMPHKSTS